MAGPNNPGPAPKTNGLSDDRRAIIASLELVRRGRDKIDEAKAANDPAILTTPKRRCCSPRWRTWDLSPTHSLTSQKTNCAP
jgi:hypothetical protein